MGEHFLGGDVVDPVAEQPAHGHHRAGGEWHVRADRHVTEFSPQTRDLRQFLVTTRIPRLPQDPQRAHPRWGRAGEITQQRLD